MSLLEETFEAWVGEGNDSALASVMGPMIAPFELEPNQTAPTPPYTAGTSLQVPNQSKASSSAGSSMPMLVPVPPRELGEASSSTSPPPTSSSSAAAHYCWGAMLCGTNERCTPGFTAGGNHFKNKFCAACRTLVVVPAARVRALTPELGATLSVSTKMGAGFWKESPPSMGGTGPNHARMRVINNTMTCNGPWLVLYEDSPPPLEWARTPEDWLSGEFVHLRIAKGTLVPVNDLFRPSKKHKSAHAPAGVPLPAAHETLPQDGGCSGSSPADDDEGGKESSQSRASSTTPDDGTSMMAGDGMVAISGRGSRPHDCGTSMMVGDGSHTIVGRP